MFLGGWETLRIVKTAIFLYIIIEKRLVFLISVSDINDFTKKKKKKKDDVKNVCSSSPLV